MEHAEILALARELHAAQLAGAPPSRARSDPRFERFRKHYPQLFAMACEPGFQPHILEHMLEYIAKIQAGQISQEDGTNAVATALSDWYVKPLVDKHRAASGGTD
jgi:hypothetical protein